AQLTQVLTQKVERFFSMDRVSSVEVCNGTAVRDSKLIVEKLDFGVFKLFGRLSRYPLIHGEARRFSGAACIVAVATSTILME
ncbi:MAG TPA: hypothetical protein VFE27_25470, partial [Acidobacteriaceae bacterium]|nr:hypothetical protein [Acidobacteriaceae bacterium]